MFTVAVANVKGGSGKSTLSTHLAARYAKRGDRTILLDLDKQRTALLWAERRPANLPNIDAREADGDHIELPRGKGTTLIDVPGGLKRSTLEAVVRACDVLVVPILPSVFDETGTERFLAMTRDLRRVREGRRTVLLVGNRVRARNRAAERLGRFLDGLEFPACAWISDAQVYVQSAETGVTLFDLPFSKSKKGLEEWAPLLAALDAAESGG